MSPRQNAVDSSTRMVRRMTTDMRTSPVNWSTRSRDRHRCASLSEARRPRSSFFAAGRSPAASAAVADDVQIAAVPQQLIARGTWGVAPVPRAAPRRSPVDRERLTVDGRQDVRHEHVAPTNRRATMTLQVSVPRRASAGKTHRRPTEDAHVEQEDSGRRRRRRHPRAVAATLVSANAGLVSGTGRWNWSTGACCLDSGDTGPMSQLDSNSVRNRRRRRGWI